MRRLFVAVCLIAVLAACSDVPQPFAHRNTGDLPIELLTLDDSSGVIVTTIDGASPQTSETLARALVAELQASNVPATYESGRLGSYVVSARAIQRVADASHEEILIYWELIDGQGGRVGHYSQRREILNGEWHGSDPEALYHIAAEAAVHLAALIQEPAPGEASGVETTLSLRPVIGAPGDGNAALFQAMVYTLTEETELPLVAEPEAGGRTYTLTGKVEIVAAGKGREHVTISWVLVDPSGEEFGSVDQSNHVRAGSLDGAWGDVAFLVAQNAATGVVALFERVRSPSL